MSTCQKLLYSPDHCWPNKLSLEWTSATSEFNLAGQSLLLGLFSLVNESIFRNGNANRQADLLLLKFFLFHILCIIIFFFKTFKNIFYWEGVVHDRICIANIRPCKNIKMCTCITPSGQRMNINWKALGNMCHFHS